MFAAAVLFWISYRLASRHRFHSAALTIALAAVLIRAYAGADLALHPWDERYHALVAKNLIANPLVPTLRLDPVLDYDFRNWESNHVWLHKPPLALWMQAASMRVFGVSEWPMRFPSLLVSTLSVVTTYGIGHVLMSPTRRTGGSRIPRRPRLLRRSRRGTPRNGSHRHPADLRRRDWTPALPSRAQEAPARRRCRSRRGFRPRLSDEIISWRAHAADLGRDATVLSTCG